MLLIINVGLLIVSIILHIATMCQLGRRDPKGNTRGEIQRPGDGAKVDHHLRNAVLEPVSRTFDPNNTDIMNGVRELYTLLQATNSVLGANLQDVYKALRELNKDMSVIVGHSLALRHLLHHRPHETTEGESHGHGDRAQGAERDDGHGGGARGQHSPGQQRPASS